MKVKFEDLDEVDKILMSLPYGSTEMVLRFIELVRRLEAENRDLKERLGIEKGVITP